MNKELEEMKKYLAIEEGISHRCLEVMEDEEIKELYILLRKQHLTPPTADEIVKELNEYYKEVWEYSENMQRKGFFIKDITFLHDNKYIGYDNKTKNIYMSRKLEVPIELAHKITTFFTQ